MTRRTTVSAPADDLATLEAEARRRGTSLSHILRELIEREAVSIRRARRPRFGLFASGGANLSELSWMDEDAPYRDDDAVG